MDKPPIKVAYICHFSNKTLHDCLPLKLSCIDRLMMRWLDKPISTSVDDFALWNTNAIEEMKKHRDMVVFHVISPYQFLKSSNYEFENEGIHYHFVKDDSLFTKAFHKRVLKDGAPNFKRINKRIAGIVRQINPDIIHMMGAENPIYSGCVLRLPDNIPILVQLQTLLNDANFEKNYNIDHASYLFRREKEKDAIIRANYLATRVDAYRKIIQESIKPGASFLNITLPLAEPVNISEGTKRYDFVYYAANVDKAGDYAIEAFIIASKKHPGITMDIIGGITSDYRAQLESRLVESGLLSFVSFEGKLPSHQDVLKQIRLSRFALLPLKIDMISGTIRESMANGLPVITTITPSTPKINSKRQCVLLSEKGDFEGMANDMIRLLTDEDFAQTLRINGGLYMQEYSSNESIVREWVKAYSFIVNEWR